MASFILSIGTNILWYTVTKTADSLKYLVYGHQPTEYELTEIRLRNIEEKLNQLTEQKNNQTKASRSVTPSSPDPVYDYEPPTLVEE